MELSKYLKGDKAIWAVFIILCLLSLVMVYSASSSLFMNSKNATFYDAGIKHGLFLLAAFFIALGIQYMNYRYLGYIAIILYIGSASLMFLLSFVLKTEINNAARWGAGFQPSEFMKLSLIVLSALFLGNGQTPHGVKPLNTWIVMILTIVGAGLVFKENFSTGVLIFAVIYMMMFIAKVRWKYLITIALLGISALIGGYLAGKYIPDIRESGRMETWVNRVDRWISQDERELDERGSDRQMIQSKIAIARSNGVGVFFGNSRQRDFLTHAYSDYIFAIIFEETGYFGTIGIILLYLILLYRAGVIANRCIHPFPALLAMGSVLILVFQALINMAVAVDLIPVTGQPLPFISKGGSSLIVCGAFIGILLSVSIHASKEGEKETPKEIKELDGVS